MAEPVISVIIPVYKTEKYLDKCVQSIVDQTYTKLEIILVDDGSPDRCPEMCDKWVGKDSRIKVIHKKTGGVASARNAALKKATGDYIAFADSDDYVEKDIYEQLLRLIHDNHADIAVCGYQINDENRDKDESRLLSSEDALKLIAEGDYKYGVLWNKLYKRHVVQGVIMPSLRCSQDLPYNYFVFKNANVIAETSLKLYHYFQNETSTVHKAFSASKFDAVRARKIILDDVKKRSIYPYAVKGYMLSCFVFIDEIIIEKKCIEFYDKLRKEILKHKKYILISTCFSKKDKIKVLIFWLFPWLYSKYIEKVR